RRWAGPVSAREQPAARLCRRASGRGLSAARKGRLRPRPRQAGMAPTPEGEGTARLRPAALARRAARRQDDPAPRRAGLRRYPDAAALYAAGRGARRPRAHRGAALDRAPGASALRRSLLPSPLPLVSFLRLLALIAVVPPSRFLCLSTSLSVRRSRFDERH